MVHKCKNQYNLFEYSSTAGFTVWDVRNIVQWETMEVRSSLSGRQVIRYVRRSELRLNSITSTTALVLSQTCWEEGG